ncbi:MAG: NAD-dependent succinate-semialdehyde dehydrogenase [Gammaproteobacteria bacterium]|nr:NAD-dependent succinate-semialdehyde dehydrogenase [Gammaproteobacteria bacterium]MDH3446862.1 NAD-dependent succinate-semialdehyde dehydrogenase [Gammaproteobacteria bacterium]
MNRDSSSRARDVLLERLRDRELLCELAYIDGEWCDGESSETFDVTNPADGSRLASVASIGPGQSRAAVEAADLAFREWSLLLPQERARVLRRWNDMILASREDLALLMTLEQGKSLDESRGEIDYGASFVEFYSEEAKRPNIEGVTSHLKGAEVEVWREPLGVAGLITPWNFPHAMLTRKAAAALAAGCTVVAHPSAETPLSALALARIAERAGFPRGVFNVLPGTAPVIVAEWMNTPLVRAISFTGSTEVGRLLFRQSADTIKRMVMELGGHAPFLVFADANLGHAVDCALTAKFATSGQDCLAANRILVERPVYDEFCREFADRSATLSVGNGLDNAAIGPLMNAGALAKQVEHVRDAVAKGARILTGGQRHPAGELFFQPTVLADVSADALLFREETFGPVAAVAPFDNEDEALRRANDTEYGLVAYVHTENAHRIYRLTRALQYGMVAVNRTRVTGAPIPFGGMKQSGLGREGARQGMEAFTEVKYVCRDYA